MRKTIHFTLGFMLLSVILIAPAAASNHPQAEKDEASSELKLETLLKSQLEGFDGGEIIVSRVSLPPNTSLPKHWHPGEEFAYILEGSVTLWQDGKENIVGKAGDVVKVPLKQVHTAITQNEGATLLVFRVHEQGMPERVLWNE
jgi:quercetin dioxygenase-like cupin family protein